MAREVERAAVDYGLGMVHPDVQKFLPSQDPQRTKELTKAAETELQGMAREFGVAEVLRVKNHQLRSVLGRIAEFHALAHDIGSYHGTLIGYTSDKDRKDLHLIISETQAPIMGRRIPYFVETAIVSGDGGVEEEHRLGLEHRRLLSLRMGLSMSVPESGITVYTHSIRSTAFEVLQSLTGQEISDSLERLIRVPTTHIGALIPNRFPQQVLNK